ncbi:MAG: hypothetical protein HLUCCO18_12995 [Rhodobacteraceae bacterium HLUCCO18]|nr:MAG: hypothetical protein HLUCCO18_12995 [Rhodobacteraceae bacterium HLUCCO18]
MSIEAEHRIVLILGSAPDAVLCRDWPRNAVSDIVAINNAWRLRSDWDYLIAPDDFPPDRFPETRTANQHLITSADYVPANNRFGGVFYAGGTMAFTAGYWALATLRPTVMAFLGCDMVYTRPGATHFYGSGRPDPLRRDPSLRSLEAKSARLMLHAQRLGCACVRLSFGDSRLVFPHMRLEDLKDRRHVDAGTQRILFDQAKEREDSLGYHTPSGRYWEASDAYRTDEVDELDRLWLAAAGLGAEAGPVRSELMR